MTDPLFHVIVRNDRTGEDTYMTRYPCSHREAVTIKSKLIPDTRRPAWCRTMIIPAE